MPIKCFTNIFLNICVRQKIWCELARLLFYKWINGWKDHKLSVKVPIEICPTNRFMFWMFWSTAFDTILKVTQHLEDGWMCEADDSPRFLQCSVCWSVPSRSSSHMPWLPWMLPCLSHGGLMLASWTKGTLSSVKLVLITCFAHSNPKITNHQGQS